MHEGGGAITAGWNATAAAIGARPAAALPIGLPPACLFLVRHTVRVGLATTPMASITPSTGMTWFSSTLPAADGAMGKPAGRRAQGRRQGPTAAPRQPVGQSKVGQRARWRGLPWEGRRQTWPYEPSIRLASSI